MMGLTFNIYYLQLAILITVAWVVLRLIVAVKTKHFSLKRELKLLTIYGCIMVIARIVYFPLHMDNGHLGPLRFNSYFVLPFWINLEPITHMFDDYDAWLINIIGNVTMFIPVGFFCPYCFKNIDSISKTVRVGFFCSLLIEITQLPFFQRVSDIDDLIMNTTGALIGAVIYFKGKKYLSNISEMFSMKVTA